MGNMNGMGRGGVDDSFAVVAIGIQTGREDWGLGLGWVGGEEWTRLGPQTTPGGVGVNDEKGRERVKGR